MRERGHRAALIGVLLELAVFSLLVAGFLWLYTGRYAATTAAIRPHVTLAAAAWLAFASVRMLLALPRVRVLLVARAAVLALALSVFVAYYALVIAGLEGWGRVITWRLIATYGGQAGDFLDALGYDPLPVYLGLGLAAGALLAVVTAAVHRFDWQPALARSASRGVIAFGACAALVIAAVPFYYFLVLPRVADAEPLALTFFHHQAPARVQSFSIAGTGALDAADRDARAAYRPATPSRRPNVILIVGDALRADHLGINGYARDTTPALQRLRDAGRLQSATAVRAVCGESSCGLMGIAQSRYSHQISPGAFALQDVLRLHGYAFHLVLGGDHTNFYELRSLYGSADSYYDGSMATDRYANDDRLVLDRVSAMPRFDGKPVFLQFHLMSAHGVSTRFAPQPWSPASNYYRKLGRFGSQQSVSSEEGTNYYDNGVLQLDGVIDALLGLLGGKGYLEDAVVVVTGDHGEMLGEGGEYAHGRSIAEPVLRIPFVMVGFGRELQPFVDIGALRSQTDIAPTLLHELGMPAPATWQGLALQQPRARRFVYFAQAGRAGVYDVRAAPQAWKFWTDGTRAGAHVLRLDTDGREQSLPIDEVPRDLVSDWTRATLPALSVATDRLQ